MPYPSEHAARLLSPDIEKVRVRRTSGSGNATVKGVKIPSSIDVIWYIVKTSEGEEVPRAQALRFPISQWTAAEAKKWIEKNEINPMSFEKAASQKKKDSAEQYNHIAIIINREDFLTLEDDFDRFPDEGVWATMGTRNEGGLETHEVQKIEFDARRFTEKGAKQWLEDHDLSFVKFKASTINRDGQDFEVVNAARFDVSKMGDVTVTDEGFLRTNAVVTRTGIFEYLNDDGTTRFELRHPDEVFNLDSLSSMKMIPITNGHPNERMVTADSAKRLSVGFTGEAITPENEFVRASLAITDGQAIKDVKNGRRELSLGYKVDLLKQDGLWHGQSYTHVQKNIRYNHLALVDEARAGHAARLRLDSANVINSDPTTPNPKQGGTKMPLVQVSIDGISYETAPEVKNALEKALSAKNDMSTDFEKVKAERDQLKTKVDELEKKNNKEVIDAAVKSRIALVQSATKVLDEETIKKIDGMTDKEIKIAVIKAKHPETNLDDKTDVYIDARFDAVMEIAGTRDDNAIDRQKQHLGNDGKGGETNIDQAKSRDVMIERQKNAWKGEQEKK